MRHEFTDLACQRGELLLFQNLSFDLGTGELVWLRGGNGVGKSSLMRQLAGLLPADWGQVSWNTQACPLDRLRHYLGHDNALDADLDVQANLSFWQAAYGGDTTYQEHAIETLGLGGFLHTPCRYLSSGQKRRTALARLLLEPRPVWLLDEPFVGLDQATVSRVAGMIEAHLDTGGTVLMISHQMIDRLWQRARVLTLREDGMYAGELSS